MHGTFFSEFPGFPSFPELVEPCNTLMADLCRCLSMQCFTKGVTLLRASNTLMADLCWCLSIQCFSKDVTLLRASNALMAEVCGFCHFNTIIKVQPYLGHRIL